MGDVQLPESLRLPAYRAARSWAVEHGHQQPDDRMLDASLDALRDAGLLVTPPGERATTYPTEPCSYLSTACRHAVSDDLPELHGHCRLSCKFCGAKCGCPFCEHPEPAS
jgi:hypothetical protein